MAPDSDTAVSGREQKILDIIETTRAKRPRFKADQVTMAHGAGGKATQTMIEGLFVPGVRAPTARADGLAALADAGRVTVDGTGLAMTTDSFVVKPLALPRRLDRRARGQRHRQRPGDGGRAAAGDHASR